MGDNLPISGNPLLAGLRPTHPGEVLREDVLPALARSKTEVARLLGVSRQTLHDILAERQPVTPRMALLIGKLTGTSADSWARMQSAYDLRREAAALGARLEKVPTLKAA